MQPSPLRDLFVIVQCAIFNLNSSIADNSPEKFVVDESSCLVTYSTVKRMNILYHM